MTLPPNRAAWPPIWRERFEERAGIMEFQANMTRDAAEWRAEQDIRKQAQQGESMKALSLTQPWATAIVLGMKHWETRSWPTSYRGEVAIHASKGFPGDAKDFAERRAGLPLVQNLPLGKILCVCDLTECRQTETLVAELSEDEQSWGDYSPGRFAFKFENVRVLSEPVLHRGALGFWNVAWDETNEILRDLRKQAAQAGKERVTA